jgi:ketosteroid isomerase-like protein
MRSLILSFAVIGLAACASAPSGPTDAEVRTALDAEVRGIEADVSAGNAAAVAARFAPDGRLVLNGVTGPNGEALDTQLTGEAQIRPFMESIGAPPAFTLTATQFARTGDDATQTGTWSVDGGAQSGSFTLDWRRQADGTWRILAWTLQGG